MTELLWQVALLLAAAFFFGAVVACSLKRRFYYGPPSKAAKAVLAGIPHAPAPTEPKVEVAARSAGEGERFNRAISGQAEPAAPAAPVAATPVAAISVASGSGAPLKVEDGGAGPSDDLTRIRGIDAGIQKQLREVGIRRFAEIAGLTATDVKGLGERLGLKGRIEAANWVGQASILASGAETYYSRCIDRGGPIPPLPSPAVSAPQPGAVAQAAPVAPTLPLALSAFGPSDDLTRIRGIDAAMQGKLRELGIRHFAQLAALNAADVKALNEAFGFSGQVEQENWLGQAAILASGGETYYSRRVVAAEVAARAAQPAVAPTAAPAPSAAPAVTDSGLGDDLTRIRGIDAATQSVLRARGINRFIQIAGFTPGHVAFLNDVLGTGGRIEQENWIEQAQVLAEVATRGTAAAAPAAAPTPAAIPVAAPAATPAPVTDSGLGDDLTRIRGIDAATQTALRARGINRFTQIAGITPGHIKFLNEILGASGRIEQENWVGQAQILAAGGETYYSRHLERGAGEPVVAASPASPPSSDIAGLRSVRSEALLGAEAARTAWSGREADDLKRIRGIGVLIEKKLNSLGILHFEQVANWTGADIERISGILDFKGRIERENWIEQARILATGGQTEFSRRSEA